METKKVARAKRSRRHPFLGAFAITLAIGALGLLFSLNGGPSEDTPEAAAALSTSTPPSHQALGRDTPAILEIGEAVGGSTNANAPETGLPEAKQTAEVPLAGDFGGGAMEVNDALPTEPREDRLFDDRQSQQATGNRLTAAIPARPGTGEVLAATTGLPAQSISAVSTRSVVAAPTLTPSLTNGLVAEPAVEASLPEVTLPEVNQNEAPPSVPLAPNHTSQRIAELRGRRPLTLEQEWYRAWYGWAAVLPEPDPNEP